MNKKKIVITGVVLLVIGLLVTVYFMFLEPNRDTQAVESAFTITSVDLVDNCLADMGKVNGDLLSADGESEVFNVTGEVKLIEKDQNEQTTIYLFAGENKPLVRCTLLKNSDISSVKKGDTIKVKGVFRSCAEYDEDLDLMEDAIIDQCDIIK